MLAKFGQRHSGGSESNIGHNVTEGTPGRGRIVGASGYLAQTHVRYAWTSTRVISGFRLRRARARCSFGRTRERRIKAGHPTDWTLFEQRDVCVCAGGRRWSMSDRRSQRPRPRVLGPKRARLRQGVSTSRRRVSCLAGARHHHPTRRNADTREIVGGAGGRAAPWKLPRPCTST